MIHSLPKASQEWQFSVTQTAEKGKGAIATPTTFIDLSKDGINRHCENEIKMTLPSKRSGNGAPMIQNCDRLNTPPPKLIAEKEFLDLIRVTETFEIFDTLTVCPMLVQDTQKFFNLAVQITNTNFLKVPIQPALEKGVFTHELPTWFDLSKNYSIA